MIDQRQELERVADVRIQQKLGLAHRTAFREKFPGQVEHCMRLVAERLQHGLSKTADVQISDASAKDLSMALLSLWEIHRELPRTD